MEVVDLTGNWYNIAKAEFQVQSSRIRNRRKAIMVGILCLGLIWALVVAPLVMEVLLENVLGISPQVLIPIMPSLMRVGMMFIWFMLLIFPLSSALQEIRIGQWEVLLSNNVSTRDIFVGTFLGRLPTNGLLMLFLAPVLVSPFALGLQISLVGLSLMYITIMAFTLSTIWLSNLVTTAIQAKLGESPRGRDLSNALALVLSLVAVIPLIGLQLFQTLMLEVLGMDIFLALPFTWAADLVTRLGLAFNGIDLSTSTIAVLDSALGLDITTDVVLLGASIMVLLAVAIASADRLFTLNIGARMETVSTIRRENPLIRGIRRLLPGSFGVLLVTALKDFGRKAQNLSRIALYLILAVVIPLYAGYRSLESGQIDVQTVSVMTAMMLAFMGSIVFGGIGFLESKDQLWIIQSVPHGSTRFVKAKIMQALLLNIPIVLIPATLLTIIFGFHGGDFLLLLTLLLVTANGSALVGIGVTASNPSYENTKSEAFRQNAMRSVGITVASIALYQIADMVLSMLGYGALFSYIWQIPILYLIMLVAPLPIVGVLTVVIGARRLARPS